MSLKEVCRTCLGTGRTMCSLVESIVPAFGSPPNSVMELWTFFSKMLIAYDDSFPDKICIECDDAIQRTYSFMQTCERSEDILKKMKHAKISLKRQSMVSVLRECNSPNIIKSGIDIYTNILQAKTENIQLNEEDSHSGKFEGIYSNHDSELDPRSQHSLTSQRGDDEVKKKRLDDLIRKNDVRSDEISVTQGIKQVSELDISTKNYDGKFCIDIFICPACRYECSMKETLVEHIIENHTNGQMCKICNKEFECTAIEHSSTHLHANSTADSVLIFPDIQQHRCKVCSKIFGRKSNLTKHLIIHTREKPYKCEICFNTFRQKSHLIGHLTCHTEERPFKCEICSKTFQRKNILTRHSRCHTGERPFKCDICKFTFNRRIHLADHLRVHTGERPFKCEICSKTFRHKSNLRGHIKKHRKNNELDPERTESEKVVNHANADTQVDQRSQAKAIVQYQGNERLEHLNGEKDVTKNKVPAIQVIKQEPELNNDKFYVRNDEVSITQGIKHEPELNLNTENYGFEEIESDNKFSIDIFKCPACDYECTVKEILEEHIIENHMNGQMCKLCSKEFECTAIEHSSTHLHVNSIADEVLISSDIKQHKCKVCSKIFGRKSNLTKHLIIHTGEKPYKCEICSKAFRQKHNLTNHIRCHTEERPFKCEICSKTFQRRNILTRHSRCHTAERPFKCDICTYTFNRKILLTDHLRVHTGERPFKCETCPKTFRHKSNLKGHLKKHTENNEGNHGHDPEQTERKQVKASVDSQVDHRSQAKAIVPNQCDNLGNERLGHVNGVKDVMTAHVLDTQDIKQEPELDNDQFYEIIFDDEPSAEIIQCPACQFECTLMESLEEHLLENHMNGQMCKLCNEEFKCTAIEHCYTHHRHANSTAKRVVRNRKSTKIEQYECQVCSKIFGWKSNLNKHLFIHTGERPYKCEICPKNFRQKHNLTAHLRCHTGERPFKCESCQKSFRQKHNLKDHLRCHTGERRFKCESCPKAFADKRNLMKHLKRRHISE